MWSACLRHHTHLLNWGVHFFIKYGVGVWYFVFSSHLSITHRSKDNTKNMTIMLCNYASWLLSVCVTNMGLKSFFLHVSWWTCLKQLIINCTQAQKGYVPVEWQSHFLLLFPLLFVIWIRSSDKAISINSVPFYILYKVISKQLSDPPGIL